MFSCSAPLYKITQRQSEDLHHLQNKKTNIASCHAGKKKRATPKNSEKMKKFQLKKFELLSAMVSFCRKYDQKYNRRRQLSTKKNY